MWGGGVLCDTVPLPCTGIWPDNEVLHAVRVHWQCTSKWTEVSQLQGTVILCSNCSTHTHEWCGRVVVSLAVASHIQVQYLAVLYLNIYHIWFQPTHHKHRACLCRKHPQGMAQIDIWWNIHCFDHQNEHMTFSFDYCTVCGHGYWMMCLYVWNLK